jgi:hypothetical protein
MRHKIYTKRKIFARAGKTAPDIPKVYLVAEIELTSFLALYL